MAFGSSLLKHELPIETERKRGRSVWNMMIFILVREKRDVFEKQSELIVSDVS